MHNPEQIPVSNDNPSFLEQHGIEIQVDAEGIESISPETLLKILNDNVPGVQVVDVRDQDEYENGHIPDVQNYPMSLAQYKTLKETAENLGSEKMIVFICQTGPRSDNAASVMSDFFAEDGSQCRAVSVTGGMNAVSKLKEIQGVSESQSN